MKGVTMRNNGNLAVIDIIISDVNIMLSGNHIAYREGDDIYVINSNGRTAFVSDAYDFVDVFDLYDACISAIDYYGLYDACISANDSCLF